MRDLISVIPTSWKFNSYMPVKSQYRLQIRLQEKQQSNMWAFIASRCVFLMIYFFIFCLRFIVVLSTGRKWSLIFNWKVNKVLCWQEYFANFVNISSFDLCWWLILCLFLEFSSWEILKINFHRYQWHLSLSTITPDGI